MAKSSQVFQNIIDDLNYSLKHNIESLEDIIDKTEDFYGLISNRLPEIEENIDETIEETKLLINYFIETDEPESEIDTNFQMNEVLENLEEKIHQVYDSLSARDKVSEILDDFIMDNDEEEAQFMEVLNLIEELEEVLSELEDLSINAIIVSAKAGKDGAGFRVISNEINRLAANIKDKYEFIEESILTLQKWYQGFTGDLNELGTIEENISSNYRMEIKEIFEDILDSLQTIADMLKDFMGHIQQSVEPIYDIIILAQNQDIIRQNLENLIEIMLSTQQEIKDFEVANSEEEVILNKLVFITEVLNLSKKLMNNILKQLHDSLFTIQEEFTQMSSDLNEIREDGEQLSLFFAGGSNGSGSTDKVSLELIYQRLIDFIPKLTSELEGIEDRYSHLISDKAVFYENMNKIQDQFSDISGVAGQFNKIKLLAKIEFTRMLGTKKDFAKDIESAIKDFIDSSKYNQQAYNDLKENLETNYSQFIDISVEVKNKINQSTQTIADSEEKLLLTKQLIKEAIQALQQSIDGLVCEIETVNQQIDECYTLQDQGEEIIDSLEEFECKALQLKEDYLTKIGQDDWVGHNERLQELMNEFTSYLERKTAQEEITDLEIDVGSEGGELTLF
ncbi:methyl-accepting chemotaxis protein [Selenihalanaerobacter shriftii]|uniref:Methyl-accepting transducer domain-containing protein n=1 Tax=Selenihalanaerobacter shriftii TaxID=142842 RepID=A0A1T4KF29_9FIRM|nr:methyl-accepting chemotaxis protein [Selenihalanaerobacter shriftii]SJZ41042.1 hypothetical protein SAMN02745118_00751 [Selenihalanaerobacter shriftii]